MFGQIRLCILGKIFIYLYIYIFLVLLQKIHHLWYLQMHFQCACASNSADNNKRTLRHHTHTHHTACPRMPCKDSPLFSSVSILEKEIASLLEKKAVVPFPANAAMGFTSTFFLAPKKSGEWRPIINLRPLNGYIRPKHFRMETLSTVLQTLSQGWWATSLDLKDAYLHVPIHANHQMFLQFIYQNITY